MLNFTLQKNFPEGTADIHIKINGLDQYGYLYFSYKIPGVLENKHNDSGFFGGKDYNESKKALILHVQEKSILGAKVNGFLVPDDIHTQIVALKSSLVAERKSQIDTLADSLVTGTKLIRFGLVGCDYPHYQPWITVPDSLNGLEQDIMSKAVKQILSGAGPDADTFISNVCDYLEDIVRQPIGQSLTISAENINRGGDSRYKPEVITSFDVSLPVIMAEKVKEEKELADIRTKVKQQTEAARKELVVNILEKGNDRSGENGSAEPFAKVSVTDPETGESLQFMCRNIFDFGYVVNPEYKIAPEADGPGGLAVKDMWQSFNPKKGGWHDVRPLTDFEKRCLKYLAQFPPIADEIRM